MHCSCGPIQKRPHINVWKHQLKENPSRTLQIKSVWQAKIKHYMSSNSYKQACGCVRKESDHMFTYPFMTVDDSLHLSCQGLKEFSNHSGTDNIHDAVAKLVGWECT